jgi:hypothetical protein
MAPLYNNKKVMGYKNMRKQKLHIKALRKAQRYEKPSEELTENDFREIENTVPLNGND